MDYGLMAYATPYPLLTPSFPLRNPLYSYTIYTLSLRNRNSVSLQRPSEDLSSKGVDIVAAMERNGFCSRRLENVVFVLEPSIELYLYHKIILCVIVTIVPDRV